ncbi:MAG: ferrous iron transport protein B [Gammaproteobacteria bacterium]|nr:ferrous iron transport protein B [Gammaproteobacteria bacterium]MDH3507014.1 ferrous iron transport protein B [Gammaproteobacteria bacterium]
MVSVAVPIDQVTVARGKTIALIGNPNSGKSTVFNRLTGLRQKTANYPGVTVEKRIGRLQLENSLVDLIDLPGTYSLSPGSDDERIAVEVLLGRVAGTPLPDAILAVVDVTRLYQGLYLLEQLAELDRPMVVALTMTDAAIRHHIQVDTEELSRRLGGAQVCTIIAPTGHGMPALHKALTNALSAEPGKHAGVSFWPKLREAATDIAAQIGDLDAADLTIIEIERALIDNDQSAREKLAAALGDGAETIVENTRKQLCGEEPPLAAEARARYRWIQEVLPSIQTSTPRQTRLGTTIVDWINRPFPATLLFLLLMAVVFQAVFAWATPLMNLIDAGTSALGGLVAATLPEGMLSSLIADGIIAGVGSVIIFLPQILILFLFIIVMEDTGYLARAAFLVDRAMRSVGLSGQSVIPLLSSFACAVPAIMATRVIPNRRDRIATILAAPFMTCSARLPVYALLIAAFVPNSSVGPLNLQGVVLFGLYMLGVFGGLTTAFMLKRTALKGPKPAFVLALPEFHIPNPRTVLMKLLDRARVFLRRAGTVIFTVAVIVWALAYFPRSADIESQRQVAESQAIATLAGEPLEAAIADIENEAAAAHLAQSWLGRAGRFVEPVFLPLGWDWRVSAAVIAGFPAREVVVAVLGTIYAVGAEAEEATLAERLSAAQWPDGSPIYTLPMVLGLLVFYAWCLQCAATLAIIKRETNSWRWPIFAWSYMTSAGYLGALMLFQLGTA